MKITKSKLKEMIQEELEQLNEQMTKRQAAEVLLQLGGREFMTMVNAKLNPILGPKGFGI